MPSRQAAIGLSLLEPVIILRGSKESLEGQFNRPAAESQDDLSMYEHIDAANLNQIRGLVLLNHERLPANSSREVQLSFKGVSVWVEWTNTQRGRIPQNCLRDIVSYTITLPIDPDKVNSMKGTSEIPFSIPVPSDLPPSVDANIGSNKYVVIASINGISAQSCVGFEQDIEETNSRSIERVEGQFKDVEMRYIWTANEQVAIGAPLSMSLSLIPLNASDNLSIGLLHILLEERTKCNVTSSGKAPLHKRWSLSQMQSSNTKKLLPWCGKSGCSQTDDTLLSAGLLYYDIERKSRKQVSTNKMQAEKEVRDQLATNTGPWNLSWSPEIPCCSRTFINNSIHHPKSIIDISHHLILQITINKPNEANAAAAVIELRRPIQILSTHLVEPGSFLPCYFCSTNQDHPHSQTEIWRQVASQECTSSHSTNVLPTWLLKVLGNPSSSSSSQIDAESDDYDGKPPQGNSRTWLELISQGKGLSTTIV